MNENTPPPNVTISPFDSQPILVDMIEKQWKALPSGALYAFVCRAIRMAYEQGRRDAGVDNL